MVNGVKGSGWDGVEARRGVSASVCSVIGCEVFGGSALLLQPFGAYVGFLWVIGVAWNPGNFKEVLVGVPQK